MTEWRRSHTAGLVYGAGVFALGFLLGIVRLTLLDPLLGEIGAVAVEVPLILFFCWIICRRSLTKFPLPPRVPERLAMGAAALFYLMLAEILLSTLIFRETLAGF